MRIFTLVNELPLFRFCVRLLLWIGLQSSASAQTTASWIGRSERWDDISNWSTNAIPTSTTHVVIGDASFTGNKMPKIDQNGLAECLSLTVDAGKAAKLLVSNDKGLTVHGDVVIAANGEIENEGSYIIIKGNWTNNGIFTENLYIKGNSPNARSTQYPTLEFTGANKYIGGTGINNFNKLIITGSTILNAGINMVARTNTSGNLIVQPHLEVNGSLDPQTYLVSVPNVADVKFIVGPVATLFVKGFTYSSNYTSLPTLWYTASTINYAGGDQVIESAIVYGVLRVSGSGVKKLNGNTRVFGAQDTGLHIDAAILDLESNTLDRDNSPGGALSIASGATLRIGGTNTFPANYGTNTLHANSTVEYYGTNQTVANITYGHLLLTTSGIKTMPVTAMTVQGNLTSSGTVSYTAGASVNVAGNVTIGTGTTFNGGSATHNIGGNWAANGTFIGNASTVLMTGTSKVISSTAGATEFFNLTLNGTGINVSVPTLTIRGNLNAPGGISQILDGTVTMTNTVSKSISGANLNFQNLTIDGIVTTGANPNLNGNFTVNAGKSFTASSGTVTMAGANKSIAGSGNKTFFNLHIANTTSTANSFTINAAMSGASSLTASAGTATFGSTSTYADTHYLYDVAITGTSMRMLANSNLYVAGTIAKGVASVFDVTTSTPNTVNYNGTIAQSVLGTSYHHLVFSNVGNKTATGAFTVNGNMTISSGSTLNANIFNHMLYGNWINAGTFNHNNGTITFAGGANASITGASEFNTLTINKAATANYVTLNNSATATMLNMTNGELRTETNALILLGDRTGNGWVIGTVTRKHSFAPGTAYAFNGPYATLAFSGGTGVTEATMITGVATPTSFTTGKSISRLYEIVAPVGEFTSASLQLQYQDSELNGCEEDGLKLYLSPASSGPWSNASRHAYDATQNWVRRNSLSDVSGFWTLTDNPSTYRWDGNVSIAWEDGANWEVITDGDVTRGVTGPTSSDFVELGGNFPVSQPTITLNEWVKDIKFYAANQMTLSVTAGSLRTNGNLGTSGGGTGTQHLLTAGAQALNIGGSLILNDGNTGNNLSLESTTGTVTVTGGIQQHESGSITLGSGTLNIAGDYTYTAGNFTAGTSTVNYNGAGAQAVGAVQYHHLSISKPAGTATYTSVAGQSISGNLSVNNAGTLDLVIPSINVAGSVSVTGGVVRGNAATIDLKGDWSTASTSSYVPGTSTVTFSGSAPQTVSATAFYNLAKTTSNTLTTTGSSTLNGSLEVQSGTLILNEHTMNRSSAGGVLTLADNATIQVNGAAVFPTNFSANTLGVNSTVTYSGGVAAIEPVTYGRLNLQNSSTRALNGNTRVANLLTIDANSILNNSAAAYTLTLDNDLTNNGNINAANTSLSFTSPAAKLNGAGTGNTIVKDVVVAAAAGLEVSKNIILHGNLVNNGTGFSAVTSQVEFTGPGPATITSATPVAIHKLLVSKTGAATAVTLATDVTGLQSINVVSGTLDAANKTLTEEAVAGTTLTVANAATIKVGAANSLPQFDNYSLAPTSTVVYNGSSQVVKSVQYGHLDLQNFGTATFEAGIAKIAGNMTKSAEANVITPQSIEFNGAVDQAVAGVNYNTLKISAPGNKTLTGNAAITDKLWLTAGMLLTNQHEITLSETATLEGEQETSFVLGTIKTTRTVPANIKTTFGGMGIAITPAVEAGLSAMTRVTGTAVGENANSIKRYYRFQAAQNADKLNAAIEASYLAADLNGHSEPDLQLYSARYLGDGWTAISEVDNTRTTKTITASGINNINFLTFSTAIKPLPVELVYFKAAKHGTDTRLEWKTAMEEDNSGFEVEVSTDGYSYQKIGFVKSAVGTSATPQIYTYTDTRNGKDGILYYRLRQLDMDGTDKFYGPCSVNFGTVTKTTVTAYPNPFISEVKLAVEAIAGGKATLTLYTSAGRVLMQHEEQVEKGTSVLQLNLYENLPRGLYLLTVEQNGKAETLKLIKN